MTYQFDDVVVDPAGFRLLKGGESVHIEPKALQILIFLLQHPGELVTKQELLGAIWSGVAVTENALTRAIAQLRKTLGDDAERPRYIETVPTRGYRFIGSTRREPAAVEAPPPSDRWKPVAIAGIVGIVAFTMLRLIARLPEKLPLPMRPAEDGPPIAARLLRSSPRLQVSPAFSPDGMSVVYSSDVDGTPHLFVSPIDGSSERQLTEDEGGEAQPAWSPDGKRIAFVSVRNGGIWLMDAGGGEAVRLTTFGSRPSWSPDGTEIAFESADDIEYGWTAFDALPPSAIWIADVGSKKAAPLTTAGTPHGGHGAPSWRRDGKRIAFSSCDHERCGIFTIARDGSNLTQIVTDPRRLESPLFGADGRTIYYVQLLYNASLLFKASVDADGNRTSPCSRLRQSNPGVMQNLALSRDGFRFAWSVVEEKSDLFAIDVGSGAAPMQLTKNPMVSVTFPSFSPDGKKIAYCAVAAGDDSGIWICDADGSNAKALITGSGLKQYTRWGRGEWDVYYCAWSVYAHRPVPYRVSLLNGRAEVAAELPEDAWAPAFSPDLETVAFNRTIGGKTSVWTSAPDGSSLRRMTADDDLARFPFWSPSGKHLAVQVRGSGSSIAILPGPKILVTGGENWPHAWSADEKQIAFAGRRNGVWNVWTVDVQNGKTRQLTNFTSTNTWVRTPSWSPDSKRIVFEAGAPRGNIWISEPRVAQ